MFNQAEHDYKLEISNKIICKFKHVRSEGLAVCLEKAAQAVREADSQQRKHLHDLMMVEKGHSI